MQYAELARKHSIAIYGDGYGTANIMDIFQEYLSPEHCIKTENDTYTFWENPSFWKTTTFESCMSWTFNPTTRHLTILYQYGDMCYGKPNGHRKGRWTFVVEDDSILYEKVFNNAINNKLRYLASEMFEQAETERRENAINDIYNQLIMNTP